MPLIRVEIRGGWSPTEKAGLLDAIHAAAAEALGIPDEDRTQILTEHPAEAFEIPPGKGDRFTLVEITMFAGRSLDAKRRYHEEKLKQLRAIEATGQAEGSPLLVLRFDIVLQGPGQTTFFAV